MDDLIMMGKTLTGKTLSSEFQVITPKNSLIRKRGYKYKKSYPTSLS